MLYKKMFLLIIYKIKLYLKKKKKKFIFFFFFFFFYFFKILNFFLKNKLFLFQEYFKIK